VYHYNKPTTVIAELRRNKYVRLCGYHTRSLFKWSRNSIRTSDIDDDDSHDSKMAIRRTREKGKYPN